MTRLDDMLKRARELTVRDEAASHHVAELSRWARAAAAPPTRSRLPWFTGGFALAAAAAAVIGFVVTRPPRDVAQTPSHVAYTPLPITRVPVPHATTNAITLGERVAIVAEPNTTYRVVATAADRTEVVVERGMVTARLWPGKKRHRLALRGADIEAVATGTVFAVAVDDRGASVHVHEGSVAVTRGRERAEVSVGTAWPAAVPYRGRPAGEQLLALATPPALEAPRPDPSAVVGEAPSDAGPADTRAQVQQSADPTRPHGTDAGAALTLKERYRRARLLRAQGNFDQALAECIAIADAKDPTWSPIALLEAARIEQFPLASPERAVVLTERFEAEWSSHQLAPEARELRCRALRSLGRSGECRPAEGELEDPRD